MPYTKRDKKGPKCQTHQGTKHFSNTSGGQHAEPMAPRQDPSVIRGYWQPVSVAQGTSAAPVPRVGDGGRLL